jgi:hypothetical protein
MDRNTLLATIKAENKSNNYLASAVGGTMPVERFSVSLGPNGPVNNCNTVHSSAYVSREWSKRASVEQIAFLHHVEQTAVIMKNNRRFRKVLLSRKNRFTK